MKTQIILIEEKKTHASKEPYADTPAYLPPIRATILQSPT